MGAEESGQDRQAQAEICGACGPQPAVGSQVENTLPSTLRLLLSPRVSFPISAALQWNPQRERAQRQVMGLERA